jgi:hypothetical protein
MMRKILFCALSTCLSLVAIQSSGQEIDSVILKQDRVPVGLTVPITVNFKSGVKDSYCGLNINFGDGIENQTKVDKKDNGIFSMDFLHAYAGSGKFTIKVEGKHYYRGLYSASACKGQSKPLTINVFDEATEKLKDEAAKKLKMATSRDAELQQKELVLQQMELTIKQKEVELLQMSEQAERDKQLKEKALMEREEALKRREKMAVRPPPTAKVLAPSVNKAQPPASPAQPLPAKGYKSADGF